MDKLPVLNNRKWEINTISLLKGGSDNEE